MGATPSTTPAICRVLLAQRGNTNRFITKNRGWSRVLRRAPREFVGGEGALARPKLVRTDPFTRGLRERACWVCPWCRKERTGPTPSELSPPARARLCARL